MKKLIALVAILSSGSLFAEDDGDNLYGLLKVNSSDSRTIVAIPWIDASTTNGEIKVVDVVRTANLYPDDTIHYYNGTGYESWRLNDATQWVAAVQSGTSGSSQGVSPEEKALERGNALILMRTNSAHRAGSFYLWGQVASSGVTTQIPKGNHLIGPPVTNDVDTINLNSVSKWTNVDVKDRIVLEQSNGSIECKYEGGQWKKYVITGYKEFGKPGDKGYLKVPTNGWVAVANDVKLGTGFWYKSEGDGDGARVEWVGVPVK